MTVPIHHDAADALAISGYRLLEAIDRRPELGVTYRAEALERAAAVRIMVIDAQLSASAAYRARFDHDVAVLSSLRHPALAPVRESGELAHRLFVVVEPPPGVELAHLLEGGPLAPQATLAILDPIADLIDRLADVGCFTGDLDANAILVARGDRPSVTRIGLTSVAAVVDAGGDLSTDALARTAPELLRGMSPGARTGVHALAAVVFEALTARPPFPTPEGRLSGASAAAVLRTRRDRPAPLVSAHRPGLGPGVDAVLRRALSETISLRPSSGRELMRRLRMALDDAGVLESSPSLTRHRRTATVAPAPPQPLPARDPAVRHVSHADADGGSRATASGRGVARIAASAALLALLAGIVVADAPDPIAPAAPAPRALSASSDALRISYPSTWARGSGAPRIPGLGLRDRIVLEQRPGTDGEHVARLVAGVVPATGSSLLPPRLEREWRTVLRREAVEIGGHEAYRYRDVPYDDKRISLTLYAVPTTAGTATIACLTPDLIDSLRGECDAMATTLELRGARTLPLGPNARFGRRVAGVLREVDSTRRAGRWALRVAKRHTGQGRRAADVADVFAEAGRRLSSRGPEAGTATVHADLVDRLRGVGAAYRTLSSSATRADRRAYNSARRAVSAREKGLSRALARMRKLGYRAR